MRGMKLLALAAAMVAAQGSYALQAMSDTAMSNATGQDGIDINLQNTNLTIGYLRWGDSAGMSTALDTTTPPTYSNPAYVEVAGFGVTGGSTDIKLSMGSTTSGAAALKVNLSANNLTFNPFVVSLVGATSVGAYNTQLTATTSVMTNSNPTIVTTGSGTATGTVATTLANYQGYQNGLMGVNLGTVSLAPTNLTITQGFTNYVSGQAMSASGLTIANAGCTGACVTIKGLQIFNPVDGSNLFSAGTVTVSDIGASNLSIGSVSSTTAAALGLTGSAAANGALWISTGASTIGSVLVQNIGIGNATGPSVGDLALVNVHMGTNNIFVSALK